MKPFPLLVAAGLAAALVLFPAVAFGAGSITFSNPASGAHYAGTQSYAITGTISPAPGVIDNVFLTVKNPSGVTVDAASVTATPSSGAFSYGTATGGNGNWVSGTYTITATDSYGAAGTATFAYAAGGTTTVASGLSVAVFATTPVLAGQSVEVTATATWANGTLAAVSTFPVAHYVNPGATTETQLGSATKIHQGAYMWTVALGNNAATGLYLVHIQANASGTLGFGTGAFTVNNALAPSTSGKLQSDLAGNFSALNTAIGNVNTAVGGVNTAVGNLASTVNSINTAVGQLSTTLGNVQTAVNGVNSAVGGLSTTLANIQTTLGNVNTSVQNLSGLSDQLTSTSNSIGSTQTYVLVVAVLAAITLVLELAILVRKLS